MEHTSRVGASLQAIHVLVYPQLPDCPQLEAWRKAMSFGMSLFGAPMTAETSNRQMTCKERKQRHSTTEWIEQASVRRNPDLLRRHSPQALVVAAAGLEPNRL